MALGSANLKKTAVFLKPYRRMLIALIVLTICMAVLAVVPPMVTRGLIDRVFTGGDIALFFPLGLVMVLLWCVYLGIRLFQSTLSIWLGVGVVSDIRFQLYRHILRLSLRFFGVNSTGKLMNRMMEDTTTMSQVLTAQTLSVVSDLIVSICAIIASITISWRLSLVLALALTAFVLNFRMNRKKIVQTSRALRSASDRLSGGVQNRLAANIAVKTFGSEEREDDVFVAQSQQSVQLGCSQGQANNSFWMNVGLIRALGSSVLYIVGCGLVLAEDLTYGDVIAFTAYATQLLWPAVRFSQLAGQIQQVIIASDRIYEIFDEQPEIADCPEPVEHPHLSGQVDFEDVHFHYVEGVEVISGFNLKVRPGQTIALIGPTGCGKSTLLNLISRFYDVTGGVLKLDGIDIRKLKLSQLRRQFGIVLQESHLFATTIRDNIRYARPELSQEAVEAAARAAEIHDFIVSLPKGYDTPVGDFGVELSVGQKQRINIARALAADPAIMIMDEATSSLDSDSEAAIQRAMERVLENRTSFIVAHRLSTIRNADQIVLLDHGHIIEQGTHGELMAIPDGRYQELYNKHIGRGVIED